MAVNQGISIEAKVTGVERTEKLARALDMVAKHSDKISKQRTAQYFNQNEKAISRVNREMQRNLVLQQQSGKSTRRMELGFQQAGYQFQDLVVQLQGGVNPFVAISQQGSQLASFFAGPWGASIGLAIAALGALGTTMMATMGLGKDLKEELSELEEVNKLLEDFGETFGKKFIGNIEEVRTTFGNLVADIYQQQIREMQSAVGKEFKMGVGAGFAESAAGSDGLFEQVGGFTQAGRAAAKEMDRRTLEVQKVLNTLSSEDIVSKDALAQAFNNAYVELEKLGYVSDEYLKKLRDIAIEQGLDLEIIKRKGDAQDDVNDALEDQAKLTEKIKGLEQDRAIDQKKGQAALYKQNGFTVTAMQLEKEIAAEILTNKAMQLAEGKALTSEQQKSLDAAIRSAQEAVQLKYELELAKDEAKELAKALAKAESALNSMKNFGNGLETALAKAKAEALALATGADVATAKAIAGFRSQQGQKIDKMVEAGVDQGLIDAEKQRSTNLINELETVLAGNAAETKRQRDAAKSNKSAQSDQDKYEEFLRKQGAELELKKKNVLLTDEVIARNEYEFKLRDKAAQLKVSVDEKEMERLMSLYDQTVELEKKRAIIDDIGDAFGDMLMNVVDGTMKADDAFKSFMSSVLKQLFQQTAVDPAVSFLKSFLMADGGVMSRGRITPFAYGGVVNGPTVFPMANGMGLMGEAGPEAIMPLKRGANGKLGVEGGGGVTVVQNINVSTGVQQTVRTEIKSLMPQIAEASKAAVADAKRRGGSYGRNFA